MGLTWWCCLTWLSAAQEANLVRSGDFASLDGWEQNPTLRQFGRVTLQLDHLYDAVGDESRRLALLEGHPAAVRERDDLALRLATLYLRLERFAEAALEEFKKGIEYPPHLSDGAPAGQGLARARYLVGLAYAALGDTLAARQSWGRCVAEKARPGSETISYRALALRKLGQTADADALLRQLVTETTRALGRGETAAVPAFVLSQAYQALGESGKAEHYFRLARQCDPDVVLRARIAASQVPPQEL